MAQRLPELSEKDQARFWSKAALPNEQGCMLWLGRISPKGYASFDLGRSSVLAHRLSYVLAYGPIPEGLEIDHVRSRGCVNRHCVAPGHLEAVTHAANVRRGDLRSNNANGRKTHCANGHPYSEANTYIPPRGGRMCRTCRAASLEKFRAKGKAVA